MRKSRRLFLLKASFSFFLCATFFALLPSSLYAQTPQLIRVGLESHFREQAQISIPSNNIAVGQIVGGYFQASGTLVSNNGFIAQPDGSYYIQLHYNFPDFTQAQSAAASYVGAVPVFLDNGQWGVYMPALDGLLGGVVFPSSSRISLSAGGQTVLVSENTNVNLQFQDVSGITSLGVRQYRGVIEIARFSGNLLTAVNIIDIEEYLFSVVPSEMPASWHMEALMAQAVAARTYTVFRLGSLASRGYDLCDTTFSQVYLGVTNEHANTTTAVNATRGIMIFHNGEPIEAVYFSSSGGFTDNSENVWVTAVPYLRAVAEIHEPGAMQWSRTVTLSQLNGLLSANNINIGNATGLQLGKSANGRVQELTIIGTTGQHAVTGEAARRFFSPALESRNFTIAGGGSVHGAPGSPFAHPPLQASAQTQDAQVFVQTASGIQAVSLQGLYVRTQSGQTNHVQGSIAIQTASGITVLHPDTTATQNQTQPQPNLPDRQPMSNAIVTTTVSTEYTIELVGRGWGHGVGMSQHGAHGMAQLGYNFRQILQHYYTGVEIR